MFKREVGPSNDVVDQEGPRAKRRKNNGNVEDVTMSDPTAQTDDENGGATGGSPSRETAKAQGLELWHIIKNAVNKECVTSYYIFPKLRVAVANFLNHFRFFNF
jgi:hypothetical protein